MNRSAVSRFVLAGLLTGITDGLFASVQSVLRGSTVAHVWQGVASTLLGPRAYEGGTRGALIGVAMHFGVAFFWSAVFVFVLMRSAWIRARLASRGGIFKVAAVYGPCIWLVMSLIVIPLLVHRPPVIAPRWWVQFFGHAIFVGLPIVSVGAPRSRLLVEPADPLVDRA